MLALNLLNSYGFSSGHVCICESWTVKKAECRRLDTFELWCWRRLLRVPWTARRSKQSILKEISPGISLEEMMLKQKLQYFGHLMRRLALEKTDAGRDWGQDKGTTEDEMAGWHHGLDGCESEWPPGVGDGQGGLVCCDSWGRKELDTTERLNWTELSHTAVGLQLQHTGSLLGCTDSPAVTYWLSCSAACGILVPRPGIKTLLPAKLGGFLTTGPTGKDVPQYTWNGLKNDLAGSWFTQMIVSIDDSR